MQAAEMTKLESFNFVIGFGRGSPMEVSKAIALMATNLGNLWV